MNNEEINVIYGYTDVSGYGKKKDKQKKKDKMTTFVKRKIL